MGFVKKQEVVTSHPGQARGSERKRRNREAKRLKRESAAANAGISVSQLRRREQGIVNRAAADHLAHLRAFTEENPSMYRSRW